MSDFDADNMFEAMGFADWRRPTAQRFCKDCIHYEPANWGRCLNSPYTDPVSGEARFYAASVVRGSAVETDCGPSGKHWKARK